MPKRKKRQKNSPYPFEFRLRAVKLYLEEGYTKQVLHEELGVGTSTLTKWVTKYNNDGEEGLRTKPRTWSRRAVSQQVKSTAVKIKKDNPSFGQRRIRDLLKRFFFIKTSPKTVGKVLSEEGLTEPRRKKSKRNPQKPRFFERATPNQMWQSDIMTFRLAGKNAYLIGYMDDYSRYMTSLKMFRSQTAENVIETLRRGMAEYGVPKEMLTDNGRQYANWRGTTRFEKELKKDRVKHIRSRPHHPMTLGKIERFWQTIQKEFLQRTQFTSWEEAQQRLAFWIKYYNYKRPHQGIGGLCPADRFFEIQHALKKTLENGVEENALELALRGKPADPFYMVGRMGDQSVVIRAEKGKVKMLVDDPMSSSNKELVYDLKKDIKNEEEKNTPNIRHKGKDQRSSVNLDRVPNSHPGLQTALHQLDLAGALAESGHGGDAGSPEPVQKGTGDGVEHTPCPPCGQENERLFHQTGEAIEENPGKGEDRIEEMSYGRIRTKTSRDHHEGELRPDDGYPGCEGTPGLKENLLQVGEERTGSVVEQRDGQTRRSTGEKARPKSGRTGAAACKNEERERTPSKADETKGHHERVRTRYRPGQKKIKPLFKSSRR